MPESVLSYFPKAATEPGASERLERLAASFAKSADDLFAKWETFTIRHGEASYTDAASLDAFQTYLDRIAKASQVKKPRLTPRGQGFTPLAKPKQETTTSPAGTESPVHAPAVDAAVIHSFNEKAVSLDSSTGLEPARVGITLNTDLKEFNFRPFYAPLRDLSVAVDAEIEEVADRVMNAYKLQRTDLVSPSQISQSLVWVVARVCREPPPMKSKQEAENSWNTKIDPHYIVLEASRRIGGGARTPADVTLVASKLSTVFEGQIVAVRGKNPKGDQFIIHDVVDLPLLPVNHGKSAKQGSDLARVAIISAPGSVAMLDDFVAWVTQANRLSAAIILGPLLTVDNATEELRRRVRGALTEIGTARIPVVLIPSPDDAFVSDPEFPQGPYQASSLTIQPPVVSVSNPCTFSLDEVAVSAAAISTLRDIRQPAEAAFRHVLRQQRMYPVYPPPPGVSIDVPHLKLASLGGAALPNMLVLPSADGETTECYIIDGVLCVAIGKLDRGFAVVTVKDGETPLLGRTRVDTLRLSK